MGAVSGGESRGEGSADSNWRGWYGWTDTSTIEPKCVIDLLTYGNGTVDFCTRGGGSRSYGLRELWPDEAKVRDFRDFYQGLVQDIEKRGILVPVLFYRINDKLYTRYGASRLYAARQLNIKHVPSLICDFGASDWVNTANWVDVNTPDRVLEVLNSPRYIGVFEVSHERIDLHNVVPT